MQRQFLHSPIGDFAHYDFDTSSPLVKAQIVRYRLIKQPPEIDPDSFRSYA
jgi:hypothetical protein